METEVIYSLELSEDDLRFLCSIVQFDGGEYYFKWLSHLNKDMDKAKVFGEICDHLKRLQLKMYGLLNIPGFED